MFVVIKTMLLDGASGIMLVLGISVVLNIVVFMYFRNRVTSLENKVDVMFQIVQEHATTQPSEMNQMNGPPTGMEGEMPQEQLDEIPENDEMSEQPENMIPENMVLDDDNDESSDDDESSADDSDDGDDEGDVKVIDMNENENHSNLIEVSDHNDSDSDDSDSDDSDDSDDENNKPQPNLVISGSLMNNSETIEVNADDSGLIDVLDLPIEEVSDNTKTLNISDDQTLAETDEDDLNKLQVTQLRDIAKEKGLKGVSKMKKKELISLLTQ